MSDNMDRYVSPLSERYAKMCIRDRLRAGKKATYIYASVHPDNQASLNMTKKCGLVQCGFRQYEDTGFVDEPYFELILD